MKKLLRVLRGEPAEVPPIWLMRQAGRYLPEYREVRRRAGSFLDLCYTPELAGEVTLQPVWRFGFDAAILFADILLVPHALGQDLSFVEGEGPRLAPPVMDQEGLGRLRPVEAMDTRLAPVYETVRRVRRSLPAGVTLIGFAGAPWTVATYMVAGRGSPDQAAARAWMYRDRESFDRLIQLLTEATIHYLGRQIEAGAEVVKLFDTWAGMLPEAMFRRYVIAPARRIVGALQARWPEVPVIGFPRGAGVGYATYARRVGVSGVALDTSVPLAWARRELGEGPGRPRAIQGNLDPMLLVTGGEALRREAGRALRRMAGSPYIVNLGHGITPEARPEHVASLVRYVREGW